MLNRCLEYLLLALIVLYAAIIRICLLNAPFHSTAEGVGSWYGIMARNYLRISWNEHRGVPVQSIGNWPGTPLRYYSHHPPLMPLTIALSYKIFGGGDWQTRLPTGLCTIGSTLLLYLLLKRYNRPAALYAAAIFACLPMTLYYGGQPEFLNPQFVFLLLLSTAAFFHFNDAPRLRSLLLLCGSFTLLGATDWPGFYFVPIATIYFVLRHNKQHWPLILAFILFSIAIFAALYAQIVLVATHDWSWMLDQFRTRTIGTTPSQKISLLTWLHQAWIYNREHHTIPVVILATIWLIRGSSLLILKRRDDPLFRPANAMVGILLVFALVHLLIGREGSHSHSWWWWPLTPFLALSSGLALATLLQRAQYLGLILILLFAALTLRPSTREFFDRNLNSAGQPYDGPTLARAVHFASPDSNTPVVLVSGDCHPSLWYYADRPIKMNVWSVSQFQQSLTDNSADLPFYFQQQCPAGPAAVIVPRYYSNAAKELIDYLRAHYPPILAPPDLATQYEFFRITNY